MKGFVLTLLVLIFAGAVRASERPNIILMVFPRWACARHDPAEAHNLAASQAEKAASMRAKLKAWRESVGAQLPTPNPDSDPAKEATRAGKKNKPAR